MRDRGPERDRRNVHLGAYVLEYPNDPGRALIVGLLQLEPVGHLGFGRSAGDRDRPRVRGVCKQCPQRYHQLGAEGIGGSEELRAELPPTHVGLDAAEQDHVTVRAGRAGHEDLGRRPGDPAHPGVVGADDRPVHLEVVELLGVDRRDDLRVPHLDQVVDHGGGGVRCVVPAFERRDENRGHQLRNLFDLDHGSQPRRIRRMRPEYHDPKWKVAVTVGHLG